MVNPCDRADQDFGRGSKIYDRELTYYKNNKFFVNLKKSIYKSMYQQSM